MKRLYIFIFLYIFTGESGASAQSANWSAILPALFPTNASGQIHGISRVSQLKFHPTNSSKMYAVSARGGLFISVNGGTTWTVAPGTDNMPFSTFASVCIDFTNDQVIYLGAGDHNYYSSWGGVTGVWKSTDGGTSFTQTSLNNKLIVEMVMDPNDHNAIVAVTDGGIYKTINGGSSWTLKTSSRTFDDLKQKTPTSRVLFAASTDTAFFRSTDFGDTWTQITSGIVLPAGVTSGNGCRIAVTPADTNVVYLGMVANSGLIYKSTNGGTSFAAMKTSVPPYLTFYDNSAGSSGQGDYNFGIGVDRLNANILYLVSHNVWKSTDGGVNWTQLTNWYEKVHTDMHQVIISPYNTSQVWNMNDGGVWLSTDGGNNWTPKGDGLYGYEIYHGTCSPTRRDMVSIGTQDNGELYANSSNWFTNRGGDWQSHCVFDYRANSSMVYYFLPDWGGVNPPRRRLVNGNDASYGLPGSVTDFNDIAFNRSNPDLAFVGTTVILRTTNLTAATPSWTQIANLGKTIVTMHSSVADPNRLYVITDDQFIYVSTNALSPSPTFNSYVLPNTTNNAASITSIKTAPNTIYITCNTKVYRSTDNGVNWTNITNNLPSVNHVRILADEYYSAQELVLVASNNAVYYKTVSSATWSIYSTNLPSRTTIADMSIFNDSTPNTRLRVATYGRGMWETPITNLHAVTANFTADNPIPCPGGSVQFSDISVGSITLRSWAFPGGTPSSSSAVNPVVVYNSPGAYNVSLGVSDGITNNTLTKTNYIKTAGYDMPVAEGFEGAPDPPDGWKNIDNGTVNDKWAKTSTAGGFGASANSMMFDNFSWNIPGERDELQVKRLDLSSYNSVTLTFDVAYQVYTGFSDSLAVLISSDCGNNFTRIFVKGGSTLSTAGSATADFIPTASQWRTETINLNSYIGQGVIIEFQNINGFGNNLYIDNVNISATVAVNAGSDINICAGSPGAIGSATVSGLSYSWSPSTGLSSSTISNPTATPAGTTTYVVTATHSLSGILNRDTVVVTVTPNSPVSVSIAASPAGIICSGTNVTFTATPTNGGATPSYQWKKNGVNVGTGNTYASSSLANNDTVKCVLTSNVACPTGNPSTSNSIIMLVNPPAGVSISANTGSTICSGTSVTFTATPVNGGGSPAYQWKKNGVNAGTGNTFVSSTLANHDTILCVMTSSLGCVSGNPATSNSIVMTVNQNATAGVSIAASPGNTVCAGTSVTYTATPVNGGPTPSYQWKKNNVIVATGNIYTNSSPVNNDTVKCVMTSNFTCAVGNPVTSNSIAMTVNPVVTASVSISANPGTAICPGASVTFTTAVANGGSSPSYQWKKNNVNVGTDSVYTTSSLSNNDTIKCIMTSSLVCASGNPATSNTIIMTVNPNVTPGISITVNPGSTICAGTSVTFTATPVNGGAGPVYFWKRNGLNAKVGTAPFYTTTGLANNDTIKCVMNSNATCLTAGSATSNQFIMTVNPNVTAGVNISANTGNTICQGVAVTFTATPLNGGTAPSYQWKKNNVNAGTGNTYITSSLANHDSVKCVMTSNAPCLSGSPASSNTIGMTVNSCTSTLHLKVFLEGFYTGNGTMAAVADPSNFPNLSDTIAVELHIPALPDSIAFRTTSTIDINGNGEFLFPGSVIGNSYYIVIRHRNHLETWSKDAVLFNSTSVSFDFTSPE